jgi:hypothetical protein
MKLKRILYPAFIVLVLMLFERNAIAAERPVNPVPSKEAEAEIKRLTNRLEEIKSMDLDNMPRGEKRVLKKEVKATKKKIADLGGGVYISAGALLVIIILLILL